MRTASIILVGLALVGGSACLEPAEQASSAGVEITPAPASVAGDLPADCEGFVVESPRPPGKLVYEDHDSERILLPPAVTDPCSCTDQSCLDRWIAHNLGCDVCVVLHCEGQQGRHVCSYCDG